jgi:hypothetical protein
MEGSESATTTPTRTTPTNNTTSELWSIHSKLKNLDESEIEAMNDTELVRLRQALKAVEDTSETVRKELADETIKGRVAPGDSLQGLNHIQSHRKYLDEDTASVIMRAVSKGISWTEFVDVNASTLAKDYPELAEIGQQEYSYIR